MESIQLLLESLMMTDPGWCLTAPHATPPTRSPVLSVWLAVVTVQLFIGLK